MAVLILKIAVNNQKIEGHSVVSERKVPVSESLEESTNPLVVPAFAHPLGLCLPPPPPSPKTALIGLYSSAKDFDRRSLIRLTYLHHKPADIDIYFVLGQPETEHHETLVTLEMSVYKDIIVLNITENMNEGKTFEFFKTIGSTFSEGDYTFVTKMDSDAWCDLPNFALLLRELIQQGKSTGVYFGRVMSGWVGEFMAGMGYSLSWDLVRWITTDEYPPSHRVGDEDQLVAEWLRHSSKVLHFVSDDKNIYDSPESEGEWAQNYTKGTLFIHRLKQNDWFLKTAEHFLGPQ